jgi:hypothetical protein
MAKSLAKELATALSILEQHLPQDPHSFADFPENL